jgi:DNA-directed RNA polymerase specialized sigma24 family protein
MLESYGSLLARADARAREMALCLRHAAEGEENERWQAKARLLKAEIKKIRRQATGRRQEIEQALCRLNSPREAQVLSLRYLSLLSYDEISEVIHFSTRHIYRVHREAAARLDELMTEK